MAPTLSFTALLGLMSSHGVLVALAARHFDVFEGAGILATDAPAVLPNLLSGEASYTLKYAGWAYAGNYGVKGAYDSSSRSAEGFSANSAAWAKQLASFQVQQDYSTTVPWFEDTGFAKLALVATLGDCPAGTAKRCPLSQEKQLCTKSYDDPSPWCELAGQPSELKGKPCSGGGSDETLQYTWETYTGFLNKDKPNAGKALTTGGCVGYTSHKSYSGQYLLQSSRIPSLATRLAAGNAMPIRQAAPAQWQEIVLPVANFGGVQLRTGTTGKGALGRWGPNFAADPVITREVDGVVQIALIQRGDTGLWALPGGMLEPGDSVLKTILKEFVEEAMGDLAEFDPDDLQSVARLKESCWAKMPNTLDCAFLEMLLGCVSESTPVLYQGIVDDPRNTDNAWMETTAKWVHCNQCTLPGELAQKAAKATGASTPVTKDAICGAARLDPATDASAAGWRPLLSLDLERELYASHGYMLRNLVKFFS